MKVKQLEWFDARFSERSVRVVAHSALGDYSAGEYSDRDAYFTVPNSDDEPREDYVVDTIDEAKAAAQADYETRILSALIDISGATNPFEVAAQIIEARLPLYTEIGQINALRECASSVRSASKVP